MSADDHANPSGSIQDVVPTADSPAAVQDEAGFARWIMAFISRYPQILGGADIFNLDFKTPSTRAGILVSVLIGITDADHASVVRKCLVLLPSGFDTDAAAAEVWQQMLATFRLLAGRDLEAGEQTVLKNRV